MKIVPDDPTMGMVMEGHVFCRRSPTKSMDGALKCYRAMTAAYTLDEGAVEAMANAFVRSLAEQGKTAAAMSIMPENATTAARAALDALRAMEG